MQNHKNEEAGIQKGNLEEKFSLFSDHWNPRIIAKLNGQHVKLAKLKGVFTWHKHEEEDEMFLVIKGQLKIEFHDKTEVLNEGDYIIIPQKTEHRPVAEKEVSVMLFEPATTVNTGEKRDAFTRDNLERI